MEEQEELQLEQLLTENKVRRRSLLPTWIKFFIWFFMIAGALAPLSFFAALLGSTFQISLYGLQSEEPLSLLGIFVLFLFILKGIVAYSLWSEKDSSINLGMADAIIGILVCTYMMCVSPFLASNSGYVLSFRLELLALIPYLLRLIRIRVQWSRN